MYKNILLALSTILLTGCGSQNGSTSSNSSTDKFQIGESIWELTLPETWEKVASPQESEAVFLARKGSENFTILEQIGTGENLAEEIYENAKKEFPLFNEINFSSNKWEFEARISPTAPLRHYIQKLFPIPNTSAFLLGTCSFEAVQTNFECEEILDSWQEVEPTKE